LIWFCFFFINFSASILINFLWPLTCAMVVDRKLIKRANIKLLILHKSLITYTSIAGKNNKLILPPP
jgi:hypothetical protein